MLRFFFTGGRGGAVSLNIITFKGTLDIALLIGHPRKLLLTSVVGLVIVCKPTGLKLQHLYLCNCPAIVGVKKMTHLLSFIEQRDYLYWSFLWKGDSNTHTLHTAFPRFLKASQGIFCTRVSFACEINCDSNSIWSEIAEKAPSSLALTVLFNSISCRPWHFCCH